MPLGQMFVEKGILDPTQLEEAVDRQKLAGGSLTESVVALGFASRAELDAVLCEPPPAPRSFEETGLDPQFLLNFILKAVYVYGHETVYQVADCIKLPVSVVGLVFENATRKRLTEILGTTKPGGDIYRYALTSLGREWALEALNQSQYVGPAPVPLTDYQIQVLKQSVTHETIDAGGLKRALSHLVLPQDTADMIGPALSSGKAMLFYGPPGNGKTSIAEAIGGVFEQTIFIPYCIEVDGQIVKLFDPAIHVECPDAAERDLDTRWVRCRRPVVLTGGELTMEMLDLSFDPVSKYYEAPAHIKATGGAFIIDDFGRQRVSPTELVNRWILPLERRIDFLTLHTGKKLRMLFDQIIVFSTNLPPEKLMDPAGLRRIHYKVHLVAPTQDDYKEIFHRVTGAHGLEVPNEVFEFLLATFGGTPDTPLAGYHAKFIMDHVQARCRFERREPVLSLQMVKEAAQNLVIDREPSENPPTTWRPRSA